VAHRISAEYVIRAYFGAAAKLIIVHSDIVSLFVTRSAGCVRWKDHIRSQPEHPGSAQRHLVAHGISAEFPIRAYFAAAFMLIVNSDYSSFICH
jgi:hypothetical protein